MAGAVHTNGITYLQPPGIDQVPTGPIDPYSDAIEKLNTFIDSQSIEAESAAGHQACGPTTTFGGVAIVAYYDDIASCTSFQPGIYLLVGSDTPGGGNSWHEPLDDVVDATGMHLNVAISSGALFYTTCGYVGDLNNWNHVVARSCTNATGDASHYARGSWQRAAGAGHSITGYTGSGQLAGLTGLALASDPNLESTALQGWGRNRDIYQTLGYRPPPFSTVPNVSFTVNGSVYFPNDYGMSFVRTVNVNGVLYTSELLPSASSSRHVLTVTGSGTVLSDVHLTH